MKIDCTPPKPVELCTIEYRVSTLTSHKPVSRNRADEILAPWDQSSARSRSRACHVRTYPCSFIGAYLAALQPRAQRA